MGVALGWLGQYWAKVRDLAGGPSKVSKQPGENSSMSMTFKSEAEYLIPLASSGPRFCHGSSAPMGHRVVI